MLITSRSNSIARQVRALRQPKGRQSSGLFLIEGIRHVGEAVEAAKTGIKYIQLECICYSPGLLTSEFANQLVQDQIAQGLPCHSFSTEVFASLADKENPQGILAVARQNKPDLSTIKPGDFPWLVALVAPQDPGNIGAILRTIDAVGASGLLLLDNSADPYHPSSVRASMGTLFWHPVIQASFAEFAHGYSMYGTSAHASTDYRLVNHYFRPLVLLMGSEKEGLSPGQAAVCQQMIRLPMQGRASSLNLAVATGIMLYDIYKKVTAFDKMSP
jgi:TrmH family RNA methyltransferase